MRANELRRMSDETLDAWNRHDVEAVVATYTDPLVYRDPNTRGAIESHEALRRYLTKLFEHWEMSWRTGEVFPIEGENGATVTWQATFRLRSGEQTAEINGIDIVLLDGHGLIVRDEVYFDRAALAPLLATAGAAA